MREYHGAKHVGRIWPEYRIWYQMIQRCTNPKNAKFHIYGARGITVCESWRSFSRFIKDMGRRPSKSHTLDRENNDGNYSPDNCRWATLKEQSRNRRTNRKLTCDGQTMTVADWADKLGVTQDFLNNRVHMGWNDERIIKEPKHYRG